MREQPRELGGRPYDRAARGVLVTALGVLVVGLAMLPAMARAHEFAFTDVRLELRDDRTWVADLGCDVDALALGVSSSADSAALAAEIEALSPAARDELVSRLEALLKRRIRVRFDGAPAPFEVTLPERGKPRAPDQLPSALGLVARLTGRVPDGAREVTFFASLAFPQVRLAVARPGEAAGPMELVTPGAESRPIALTGPALPPGAGETLRRFLALGVTHILPFGLDHVLFVAGLALLSPRLGPLLAQVTAFTLAHTLTLALSSYGFVSLPSRLVEPLIALSIVYVGVENAVSPRLRPSRLVLVFAFGLLHGLGFAGVLAEMGLPERHHLLALLAFNAGVEIGQLAVIALVAGALALWARRGGDRRGLVRPASLAIAAVGLFWTVERALGL
ncbi:MAG TPA: HupE/UreJ family protein [Vicinamibacteria bacterium]|nr:HupE/UreJ family protein [Vicinamibacteria bacterium]